MANEEPAESVPLRGSHFPIAGLSEGGVFYESRICEIGHSRWWSEAQRIFHAARNNGCCMFKL
jgi:hypothetical protein